jgi:hypothetical protein
MKKIFLKIWPILCIILLWFIFASPYFLKGLVPFPSKYLVTFFPPWSASYGMPVKNNAMPDVITQIYPWKKLTIDTWKLGHVPLWNPYSFSGTPHAANYQSAVFSPFNLLFFVMPMEHAWSWLILLQPLLAGICMYIYLRQLRISSMASLVGSFSFMFCGFLVVWMAYGTLGYAALWLPLALFAVARYLNHGSWWAPPILALSLAFSLFSGHFQISLYVLLVVLGYLLVLGMHARLMSRFAVLFLFYLGGVLLALPQIWPTMMTYQNALRSDLYTKGEVIPWQYFITIFAPDFYGNPVTRNDWFGHYAEWSSYAGVATLLLAAWTIWNNKKKEHWFWIGTFFLAICLAYPTFLNDLLYQLKVPVLSTSSASRIILLASFSLCILASFGLDNLRQAYTGVQKKKLILFSSFIFLFLTLYWLVILVGNIFPSDKLVIAKRNSILPTLFTLGGLGLFWVMLVAQEKYKKLIAFLIVCLIGMEVLRFSTKWMPFEPAAYIYPQLPVIQFLQKTIGIHRLFGNYGGELANYYAVPSLEGYDAVYSKRYGQFISYVNKGMLGGEERSIVNVGKNGKYLEEALQLLGVKYILHRVGDGRNIWAYPFWNYPYYKQVYKDDNYEVYENETVYPRVFLASSYVIGKNENDVLKRLFDKDTNRMDTLVLETRPQTMPQMGTGSAQIDLYTPTEVRIHTDTLTPKLLFLSDSYDQGWKAFVDGKQTPVYRANYDFRAIDIPAGDHIVVFRYWPKSVENGIKAAILTFLILSISTILLKSKRER